MNGKKRYSYKDLGCVAERGHVVNQRGRKYASLSSSKKASVAGAQRGTAAEEVSRKKGARVRKS